MNLKTVAPFALITMLFHMGATKAFAQSTEATPLPDDAKIAFKFKDESQLGIADVSGNANSESYNAAQANEFDWYANVFKLNGRYLQTRVSGVDTAHNWGAALRYERVLTDYFDVFANYGLESDVFAAYVQRNSADVGAKYYTYKGESFKWWFELGYRNTVTQFTSISPATTSSVRLYTETQYAFTKTTSFRYWVEYIPSIGSSLSGNPGYTQSQDYQINTEPSISTMMNDVFSLKMAYLFKYNNYLPPNSSATKYLDTTFTSSLVAHF